jgi:lysophospholipase L1-like esterase
MTEENQTETSERLRVTNEMQLSLRQWAIVAAIVTAVALTVPRLWKRIEHFDVAENYRIPYQLSNDYWLFQWRLEKQAEARQIVVLGDSVVWGEYVKADGTLTAFLDRSLKTRDRFVNAGVNGLFPLALEGLVRSYGGPLRDRKVIVVCNLLWLSSPKADMQLDKAESVNHAVLLPQFFPRIPSYQPDANERLSAVIGRNVAFLGWVNHVQDCYFHQESIPRWTLDEDPNQRRSYPNTYKNPLAQITLTVPGGQDDDAQRGPGSLNHIPWSAGKSAKFGRFQKSEFEWVELKSSLQWAAFRRTVELLRTRGNDVLVVLSPFNEHMIADSSREGYAAIRAGVLAWLGEEHIPFVAPAVLPSKLYADASHPLTAGYEELARQMAQAEAFRAWLAAGK